MATRGGIILLLLVAAVQGAQYRFEGRIGHEIPTDGARLSERRASVLLEKQDLAKQRFVEVLGDSLISFQLEQIQIHGAQVNDPLAVLVGYFESPLSRAELSTIFRQKEAVVTLFHLAEVGVVPPIEYEDEAVGAPVAFCRNGGVLFPNATCACPSFYSGDSCEVHNCANGGVLDTKGKCNCPPGFQSEHCQARSCTPGVNDNYDFTQGTLYYTISTRAETMGQDLDYIITNTRALVSSLNSLYNNYYGTFVLTTFVQTAQGGTYMKTDGFSNQSLFFAAMDNIQAASGTPTQPLITAMAQTVTSYPNQRGRSFLYLFADSEANDYVTISHSINDQSIQAKLVNYLMSWRIHPQYILTASTGQYPTNSQSWTTLLWIAEAAHGDAYLIPKSQNGIGRVLVNTLEWHINAENFYVANAILCKSISITPPNSTFHLNLYNPVVNATVTYTNGTTVQPRTAQSTGNLKQYEIQNTLGNIKSINVAASDSDYCGARAYVSSKVAVLNAFTYDGNFDNGDVRVVQGLPLIHNVLVVGKNVLELTIPWTPIAANDTANQGSLEQIKKRTNFNDCTFAWTIPSAYACTPGPFTSQFNIDGEIHLVPNYCYSAPAVTPAALKCLNGGVVANNACNCTANYQGNVCQTPICVNGGTANVFAGNGQPICVCPPGYSGTFCDALICNRTSGDDIDATRRSFGVAIQNDFASAHTISYLQSLLGQVVNGSAPGYYIEYVLTQFRSTSAGPVIRSENIKLADVFKNETASLQFTRASGRNNSVYSALITTLLAMSKPRSAIYAFVNEASSGDGNNTLAVVKELAIARQMRINVVLISKYGDISSCVTLDDANVYQDLAMATGGVLVDLCRDDTNITSAFNFLSYYITKHDYLTEVAALRVESCKDPIQLGYKKMLPDQKFFIIANSISTTTGFTVTVSNGSNIVLPSMSSIPSLGVYEPGDLSGDVQITVGNGGDVCSVYVLEQTPLSAFITFATDPSSDSSFANPQLQAPLYPAVRLSTSLQSRPKVTITATEKDFPLFKFQQQLITRQDSCLYDQYSTAPFACTKANDEFFITVTVETSDITLNRVVRAFCRTDKTTCLNGGTYDDKTAKCVCLPNYSGDNCENKNCQNQGNLTMGICVCPALFGGEFCEYAMCTSWDYYLAHDPRTANFRTVAFGVETTTANKAAGKAFAAKIMSVMAEIAQDDFSTQYALVTYDDQGITRNIITPDSLRFSNYVNNLLMADATYKDASAMIRTDLAISALHGMTSAPAAQNPSIIIIITASNTNKASAKADLKPREGTQINFIYTATSPSLDVTVPNFDYLNTVAYQSGGRFLPMTVSSLANNAERLIGSMLRAHALVSDAATIDCSKGLSLTVSVESVATELYIDVAGLNAATGVALIDGAGKKVTLNQNNTLSSDIGSAVYLFRNNDTGVTLVGKWNISISAATKRCQIQARVRSPIQVAAGFTEDLHSDYPDSQPSFQGATNLNIKNSSIYVTGQIANIDRQNGAMIQGIDVATKDVYNGSLVSGLSVRMNRRYPYGCSHQFISEYFVLDKTNHDYQIIFRGVDSNGTDFSRTAIYTITQLSFNENPCHKGGNLTSFGFCNCDANHWGMTCDYPICQNGGTIVGMACLCPVSYYGTYCEKYISNLETSVLEHLEHNKKESIKSAEEANDKNSNAPKRIEFIREGRLQEIEAFKSQARHIADNARVELLKAVLDQNETADEKYLEQLEESGSFVEKSSAEEKAEKVGKENPDEEEEGGVDFTGFGQPRSDVEEGIAGDEAAPAMDEFSQGTSDYGRFKQRSAEVIDDAPATSDEEAV
ncbi:unnamed protein product, partial [Mesorhabditis spiculigera]